MPEFDTYKGIERYAKDPNSPEAKLGFRYLCRRTETAVVWNAASLCGVEGIDVGCNLYTGTDIDKQNNVDNKNKPLTADSLIEMSREDQIKLYTDLCKQAGIDIDPTALIKEQQSGVDNNNG